MSGMSGDMSAHISQTTVGKHLMDVDNFRCWLIGEIREILDRKTAVLPLLLWLDPDQQWLDLLRTAAPAGDFELWADPAEHELIVRDRFHRTPRAARVVWLPVSREAIAWFKPFELEAEAVWEKGLLEALREFGVYIPREHESEMISELPAYAREWFDQPREAWKELTPGNARGTLVNDARMLQVLAGEAGEFERLQQEGRFDFFASRAVKDFGLPEPIGQAEESWRVAAMARLLATEAAEGSPQEALHEGDKIVPAGLARKRVLGLLKSWQNDVRYISTFERLVPEADKTIGLAYWARNLSAAPRSRASRAVEETLFGLAVDRLDRMEPLDLLAKELDRNLQMYKDREKGFWGCQATDRVDWRFIVGLAGVANLLVENEGVAETWKSAVDAVAWYGSRGWRLDSVGEQLFKEEADFPGKLQRVRARLRRGYLRAVDEVGAAFSELLAADTSKTVAMTTAGEAALAELQRQKGPTALVFLDACRFDLGQRLAEMLNQGEPVQRATVASAVAAIPSITELGMALALPMARDNLCVGLTPDGKGFLVKAEGFAGNLALAAERRKWLKQCLEVKDCWSIDDILDGETLKPATKTRRLIAVHGKELDQHDGQLQLTGADDHLHRYVQAIRRLRDAGYHRVIVVTDHGFFHWQPEEHEFEEEKPGGDLLWQSRRAMVGQNLTHPRAVKLPVACSDLEAMVPRSVNAFRTYGRLGFFHGGATLQEMVIPVVVATWPAKSSKVEVVLKPVVQIATLSPRMQVQAGMAARSGGRLFGTETNVLARRVMIKVREPVGGDLVFKHGEPVTVEPEGEPVTVSLQLVQPGPELAYGTPLLVQVLDADNEEILTSEPVTLKVEINEW